LTQHILSGIWYFFQGQILTVMLCMATG